jgi:hypothetical protein
MASATQVARLPNPNHGLFTIPAHVAFTFLVLNKFDACYPVGAARCEIVRIAGDPQFRESITRRQGQKQTAAHAAPIRS